MLNRRDALETTGDRPARMQRSARVPMTRRGRTAQSARWRKSHPRYTAGHRQTSAAVAGLVSGRSCTQALGLAEVQVGNGVRVTDGFQAAGGIFLGLAEESDRQDPTLDLFGAAFDFTRGSTSRDGYGTCCRASASPTCLDLGNPWDRRRAASLAFVVHADRRVRRSRRCTRHIAVTAPARSRTCVRTGVSVNVWK